MQQINDLISLFNNNVHEFYVKLKSFSKTKIKSLNTSLANMNTPLINVVHSFFVNKHLPQRINETIQEREAIVLPFSCNLV